MSNGGNVVIYKFEIRRALTVKDWLLYGDFCFRANCPTSPSFVQDHLARSIRLFFKVGKPVELTGSSFGLVMAFQVVAVIPLLWAALQSWLYGQPHLQLGETALFGRHFQYSGVDFYGGHNFSHYCITRPPHP